MLRLFAITCLSLLAGTMVAHANRLDELLAGAELRAAEIYRKETAESWGDWFARIVPIPALTSTDRPFGRSYGLVIGVSDFGGSLDPLPATANNPTQMRQLLIDQKFDLVITLANARATKQRIEYLMIDLFPEIVTENDRFLFYFSGHGVVQASGEGFLPLTAAQGAYSNMLPMRGVRTWDGSLRQAKQVLFLLDTCFSGLAGVEPQAPVDLRNLSVEQLAGYGHHLLTATTAGEQTIASRTFSGSIFTSSLIEAAQGAADNPIRWDADGDGTEEEIKDGVISMYELLSHVRTAVAVRAEEVDWGASITPQLQPLRSSQGEFFFVTQERMQEVSRKAHEAEVQSQPGTPPARLDPATAEAALNLRPEDRMVVQEALIALGFDTGGIDGVFGANTRRAIVRWQRDRSEEATSYLTATQHGRLLAEAEPKLAARATAPQKSEQASDRIRETGPVKEIGPEGIQRPQDSHATDEPPADVSSRHLIGQIFRVFEEHNYVIVDLTRRANVGETVYAETASHDFVGMDLTDVNASEGKASAVPLEDIKVLSEGNKVYATR